MQIYEKQPLSPKKGVRFIPTFAQKMCVQKIL
jgi:hypothetical protein